jgi:hypothetical protein
LEPFDLAAGGGVVGSGVLLVDAEPAQFGLEGVAAAFAAGEAGGEHHAVVRECRCWWPVPGHGVVEGVDDDAAGDVWVGRDRQGVAGVVIEPGQDFGVGTGGEAVVGDVGLPHFVGLVGLEAGVGRAGPLGRCRHDHPSAAQHPVDRCFGHGEAMVVVEMPGDGVSAGIQPLGGELGSEPHDQLDRRASSRAR